MMDENGKGELDVHGVEIKYILSCKDHFTQFVMLSAVPPKRTTAIAHHLSVMFGVIGYPSIYHTDNGLELCGNAVIEMIMKHNPHITTCQGRPRKPRDQGSIENANKSIRNMVQSYVAEEWSKDNTT